MGGLDHRAPPPSEPERPETAVRNARYGLALFAIYLALYGTFVLLNAFAPGRMETPALAGVNLATIYGFGLIATALFLALIYGWLCRRPADAAGSDAERGA
jgi:uncharacterized membrane protein (DUF485 family)